MKTQEREICQDYIDQMTDEQCKTLMFLFELANGNNNKGEIMKFTNHYENVDSAIPQQWADDMRNDMRVHPRWYVWSYLNNHIGGEPVHLLEVLFKKLIEDLEIK